MIDKILPGYAGIDVGASEFYVAAAGAAEPVKRFGTFTSEIRLLTAYLKEHGVQKAAMETTGVYWVPLHDALEAAGIEVTVFNGAHARNLPGRKSDASDCQWHGMLHSHGLLSPIFIPPQEILELRAYHRLREDHIAMAASHIQHMQRALDLMNVRLHNVISQIHGVSGLKIVRAILAGERDPVALALLCDQQILKHKKQEVIKSLEGNWREHHLFALGQALEGYEFYQKQIADCDANIERILRKLGRQQEPPRPPRGGWPKEARHNAPLIENLQGKLLNCSGGCDPTRLPGFSPLTFMKLVAELGTDLSPWPTETHLLQFEKLEPHK